MNQIKEKTGSFVFIKILHAFFSITLVMIAFGTTISAQDPVEGATQAQAPTSDRPPETQPDPSAEQIATETQTPTPPETNATPDQTTQTAPAPQTECERASQRVQSLQQEIFGLKESEQSNQQETLMQLLVQQDELKARKAVVDGLLGIWDEYHNYLGANERIREETQSHLQAHNSVAALNSIKGFIDGNQQAVSRYHLLSEAFSQFDPSQFQGKSKEEVFNYVKTSMQNACEDATKARALGYCQASQKDPNFWSTMTAQAVAPPQAESAGDLIHKFIEVTSVSAKDWGPTDNWMENLSTLFVDNSTLDGDLMADDNLSEIVAEMIDQTVQECRKQALTSANRQVDCLADSSLLANHPKKELLTAKLNLQNPQGPKTFNSMRDIIDAYLENAEKVSSAHHENVGGTITALNNIAAQRQQIVASISQGNQALNDDTQAARADLKRKANMKMAALARELDSIKNSKKLFSNYMNDVPGLSQGPSQAANEIIKELMGDNAPANIFQLTTDNTFKISDDAYEKIFSDPNFSKEALTRLLSEPQEKYNGKSINQAEADIAKRIADIRATQQYKDAEAFKNFAWDSLLTRCREDPSQNAQEVIPESCPAHSQSESEVRSLLQVGNSLIAYQSNLDDRTEVADLNQRCQDLYRNSRAEYDRNYIALCNEINAADIRNTREVTVTSNRQRASRRRSRSRKIYYEEDGLTPASSYTPKSNFALFLPAAAQAFTTILPMWSQTPLYQSYALSGRIAGQQQTTYNAWLQARNQSFANQMVCTNGVFNCFLPTTALSGTSPTLGNSAFGFGGSSTVFGSTTTSFGGF